MNRSSKAPSHGRRVTTNARARCSWCAMRVTCGLRTIRRRPRHGFANHDLLTNGDGAMAFELTCDLGPDGQPAAASDRAELRRMLTVFAGKRARLVVSRPRRSDNALSRYWIGVLKPIADALRAAGVRTNEQTLHVEFKRKYLSPRVVVDRMGAERVAPPSTDKLTDDEFAAYLMAIESDDLTVQSGAVIEPVGVWLKRRGQDRLAGVAREPRSA